MKPHSMIHMSCQRCDRWAAAITFTAASILVLAHACSASFMMCHPRAHSIRCGLVSRKKIQYVVELMYNNNTLSSVDLPGLVKVVYALMHARAYKDNPADRT